MRRKEFFTLRGGGMIGHVKEALEIVKAQARGRTMTEGEITSMLTRLVQGIQSFSEPGDRVMPGAAGDVDPKKAVKETSITCCECGKSFKILTKKHLLAHALTPVEYRAKHGYKKGASLACKALQRTRRKQMKDMELWKRRIKKGDK